MIESGAVCILLQCILVIDGHFLKPVLGTMDLDSVSSDEHSRVVVNIDSHAQGVVREADANDVCRSAVHGLNSAIRAAGPAA